MPLLAQILGNYTTRVRSETFVQSLSDEYVYAGPDYPEKDDPDGFIWGVRYSVAYPGLKYIDNGERSQYWSKKLGQKMHEITLETEAFFLRLVFANIRYASLGNEPEVVVKKDYPINLSDEI